MTAGKDNLARELARLVIDKAPAPVSEQVALKVRVKGVSDVNCEVGVGSHWFW